MKLSLSTLAFVAMAGSASASLVFDPPIPFTQYDGDCAGDVLYTGAVVSVKKMEYGSFCISDNINTGDETIVAYSRVDIVQCEADKIYENWNSCTDADCGDCEAEYKAYTGWDSINPETLIGFCYDYTFSLDPITASTRKVAGTFDQEYKVNFAFDADADLSDAEAYVKLMDDNSCIAYGKPLLDSNMDKPATMPETEDIDEPDEAVDDSGASTLGATAVVALAAATTMLLV